MSSVRSTFSRLTWALLSLFVTGVIFLGAVYVYMELQLPNVEILKDAHYQVPLRIYTREGKLIAEYGTKRRVPVSLDSIPKPLIQAVLATEDARYYSHPGVDFIGLARAAKAVITSGRKVQGASTITMQVARNFFLDRKKTYSRKLKEILLALKIDKELSKDKVLELYLNKVYFGRRAYGVGAASQIYYNKPLNQLTLPEMAMLAGLPQAPSRNNPIDNPTGAKKRRNHVLRRMLEVGDIDQKTYQNAIQAPVTARYHGQHVRVDAPHLAEMVRILMLHQFGKQVYEKGFTVITTLSSTLQEAANQSLRLGLIQYSERHGYQGVQHHLLGTAEDLVAWLQELQKLPPEAPLSPAAVLSEGDRSVVVLMPDGQTLELTWAGLSWARPALPEGKRGKAPQTAADIFKVGDIIWVRRGRDGAWRLSQSPRIEGALVSLDPQNGAILALAGGFNFKRSHFNRVTMAKRQPGSNIKPFLYSAALARGYTLASVINDAPFVQEGWGENLLWRPQNDNLKFYGPTRLRVGLTKSRNVVSVRLLKAVGIPYSIHYLKRFGFNPNKLPKTLSLALGAVSISPLKMSAAYAVFANGGYRVFPYYIERIEGQGHKLVYQSQPPHACDACQENQDTLKNQQSGPVAVQVITPQNAYLITKALQGVIKKGTGRAARVLKRSDIAGKTGTTNKQVDAWFSGYNSHINTTVWVGFDNQQSTHEFGAQVALPIWIHFMRTALQGMPESTMPQPPNIVVARIDPKTGLLARPNEKAIFEDFRKQYEPKEYATAKKPLPHSLF